MTRVEKDKTKIFKNLKYEEHIICLKIKKKIMKNIQTKFKSHILVLDNFFSLYMTRVL